MTALVSGGGKVSRPDEKLPLFRVGVKYVFYTPYPFFPALNHPMLFVSLLFLHLEPNIVSLMSAFCSRSLTYDTRSMYHSAELKKKVIMSIPVSSKRRQKQCQD